MKRLLKLTIASCLVFITIIAFLNFHVILAVQAQGSANEKVWGTPLQINQYIIVGDNKEIVQGHYAYVIRKQSIDKQRILPSAWYTLLAGDLRDLKADIERQVPGSVCTWLRVSWTDAYLEPLLPHQISYMVITGFMVEAIVENVNAGLTGLEIVVIIMAIAFLATVIVALTMGSWIIWEVINAAKKLPENIAPWVIIAVGLFILVGIGASLYFLFGGRVSYSSKKGKRNLELGKSKAKSLFFYW